MATHPFFIDHYAMSSYGRLHWRSAGCARAAGDTPIVLVHGLGVSGTYLLPLARELAAEGQVYVPDLPGVGRSDKPKHVLDVQGFANALREWMDARAIGSATVLGHSLGCQVAVDLALRFPARVKKLVLVSPTFDPAAPSPYLQLFRLMLDALRETPSLVLLASMDYLRAGPLRVMRTLQLGMQDRIEENILKVHAPALVVTGSADPIAPPRWAQELSSRAPAGQFAQLAGGPHAVNFSKPRELAEIVRQFLGKPEISEEANGATQFPCGTAQRGGNAS